MGSHTKEKTRRKNPPMTKVAPYALEAEQALLGSVLLSNEQWEKVSEMVVWKDFYITGHQVIFKAMRSLYDGKKPIDLVTLAQTLEDTGALEQVGGFAYLAEMSKNTPSASNISTYAQIIREQSILRELIQVAQDIADLGFLPAGRSPQQLIDLAEAKVFDIANQRRQHAQAPVPIGDLLDTTLERIEHLYHDPNHTGITGLASGFTELDKKTAGWQNADLIIVAARPSMGKTTFALNLCEYAALSLTSKPVLIFSLEMPANQLMIRLLASLSRIDQRKLHTGQLSNEDWARLSSSVALLQECKNLYIDDSSLLNVSELRARARRIYRENGGLSLIMIDYLQLMVPSEGQETRALEIAEISRNLKALAKELSIPVVALSQLNRGLEQRADKRPLTSDLRESGSIEQDADLVLFIYRDEVYDPNSPDKGVAEVILGKHRNGPLGSIKLTFQPQYARFDNHADARLTPKTPF